MMMRSVYRFIAPPLLAALLLPFAVILPVRAHNNNQNAVLTTSSEVNQTLSPTDFNPTKTPKPPHQFRPTATPIHVPPPSDPGTTQMMVLFGIFIVIIVIFGIWLNRRKVF